MISIPLLFALASILPASSFFVPCPAVRKSIVDIPGFKYDARYLESDMSVAVRDEEEPDAPTVIFLPGIEMSCLSSLQHRVPSYKAAYVCAGPRAVTPYSEMCDRVEEYVRSRGLSRVVLVGESFGSLLALSVADRLGGIVKLVVILNPATSYLRSGLPARVEELRRSPDWQYKAHIVLAMMSNAPDPRAYPVTSLSAAVVMFYMLCNLMVLEKEVLLRRIDTWMHDGVDDVDRILEKGLQVNIVVVTGMRDSFLPFHADDRLTKQCTVVKVVDGSHLLSGAQVDLQRLIHEYLSLQPVTSSSDPSLPFRISASLRRLRWRR